MDKELSEMTLEELWELFPVRLVRPDKGWKDRYQEMEDALRILLSEIFICRISHIGSTAIDGIWAKNIVDVLIEFRSLEDMEKAAVIMEENGFIIMSSERYRISLNRGYTKKGFEDKVYHIHLRIKGDNDELYFRDLLNEDRELAKEYEDLKIMLSKEFEYDRDAYTEAKGDLVRKMTSKARKAFGERYR